MPRSVPFCTLSGIVDLDEPGHQPLVAEFSFAERSSEKATLVAALLQIDQIGSLQGRLGENHENLISVLSRSWPQAFQSFTLKMILATLTNRGVKSRQAKHDSAMNTRPMTRLGIMFYYIGYDVRRLLSSQRTVTIVRIRGLISGDARLPHNDGSRA